VKIILAHKIFLENTPDNLRSILMNMLKIDNPVYKNALKLGKSVYKIPKFLFNYSIDSNNNMAIPRGMRVQLLELIRSLDIKIEIEDLRNFKHIDFTKSYDIKYRSYQQKAVEDLIREPEGILNSDPGSGKTVMALSLIPILQNKTLWITHTNVLASQCVERAKTFLHLDDDEVGIIGGGKNKIGSVLTVCMVQTLVRRPELMKELYDEFGLLILDETHHLPSTIFTEVVTKLNTYYMYGLTATAYRRDGLETLLFQTMGPITSKVDREEVEDAGGIIKPTVVFRRITTGPKVEGVDVSVILNNHVVYNPTRNELIKQDVLREARAGGLCIVASSRRDHCEVLYELIRAQWPKTGIATGRYSKKLIQEQIEAFESDKITVLVATVSLLGEGMDISLLNRLFITTPLRAEGTVEQLVGRVQRSHPGKTDAIVYDYVDDNIGIFRNQFYAKNNKCRYKVYSRLGLHIQSYEDFLA